MSHTIMNESNYKKILSRIHCIRKRINRNGLTEFQQVFVFHISGIYILLKLELDENEIFHLLIFLVINNPQLFKM
ncbi:unnamed protein product [Paramecium pentaurelia]|uniref:Uncharacterized protein n=1 Tax=Paramecium pentaurelia TaxID=43138 RepID=A0A8S1YC02_9CILI|nr:unnamed protein product [Paramecium pentaurelia]